MYSYRIEKKKKKENTRSSKPKEKTDTYIAYGHKNSIPLCLLSPLIPVLELGSKNTFVKGSWRSGRKI
jgi:hypothetical protein